MILVEEVRSLRYFKAIDKVERKVLCDLKLLFFLERQKKTLLRSYFWIAIQNNKLKTIILKTEPLGMNGETKIVKRILDLVHGRGRREPSHKPSRFEHNLSRTTLEIDQYPANYQVPAR